MGYRVTSARSSATVRSPSPQPTLYSVLAGIGQEDLLSFFGGAEEKQTLPQHEELRLLLLKGNPMDQKNSQSSCVPQGHHNVKQDSMGWYVRKGGQDKMTPLTGR